MCYIQCVDAHAALADPTRRRIVELLAECPHDVPRRELDASVFQLDPRPLAELDDWLARYRAFWAQRLDALELELRRARKEHS